jgi:hypothetical protein
MGDTKEKTNQKNLKKNQRAAYDRRAGNDRRSSFGLDYDGTEERNHPERRMVLGEHRIGWVRDTKWSSINLDLLR